MLAYASKSDGLGLQSEAILFQKAQAGCSRSLDQLMTRHERLVHAVVRRQALGDLPRDEALQAGRMGLWRAILGFNPQRGLAFSTYAWPSIMRQVWRAVKVDTRARGSASGRANRSVEPAWDLAGCWEAQAAHQALHHLVQRLPDRLRQIVIAHYGLDGAPPASYRALAPRLGMCHTRVHQLHTEALVWLRLPAHSQDLRTWLDRHTVADYQTADALAQRHLRQRGGRHEP
jgi:RNA polymerase sigma factor (sigma-70 family)